MGDGPRGKSFRSDSTQWRSSPNDTTRSCRFGCHGGRAFKRTEYSFGIEYKRFCTMGPNYSTSCLRSAFFCCCKACLSNSRCSF
ncbi:hypothetical protein J6590_092682 [Homalodisca vitripennis]|nr:hypothetical protein J6590_092682 [Homalodisca vitripennis]